LGKTDRYRRDQRLRWHVSSRPFIQPLENRISRSAPAACRNDDVFGKWIGRNGRKAELPLQTVSVLAPFAGLPAVELAVALRQLARIRVKPGLFDYELPAGRHMFLEHGCLQIQTHTGYVLQLKAGTPQARYPLPARSEVLSLYAAEPCTLLSLPDTVGAASQDAAASPPVRPPLHPEEVEALGQLRDYFRREHAQLPSLPDLAIKIGKAIDDPNNRNEDIARLIQLDPALSARLISVTNSAAFGGFNKVTGIKQATNRLGRQKLRSLVYSCLMKGIFNSGSAMLKRRMRELWQHSVHVASLSFVLGRETPGIDSEQALLAGLIHDIGAVAVIGGINRFPVLAQRAEVLDYALDSLRIDVGLLTLRRWRLQETFGDVIREAENWRRVGCAIPQNVDVVILAQLHALVGNSRGTGLPRLDTVPAFSKLARGELTPRHSLTLLEEAEADIREVRALLGATQG